MNMLTWNTDMFAFHDFFLWICICFKSHISFLFFKKITTIRKLAPNMKYITTRPDLQNEFYWLKNVENKWFIHFSCRKMNFPFLLLIFAAIFNYSVGYPIELLWKLAVRIITGDIQIAIINQVLFLIVKDTR